MMALMQLLLYFVGRFKEFFKSEMLIDVPLIKAFSKPIKPFNSTQSSQL